jgi:hypothetical protein
VDGAVGAEALDDIVEHPPLGGLEAGERGPDGAGGAVALGDLEAAVVEGRGDVAVVAEVAELGDREAQRLGELLGGVEGRELVLCGAFLGAGEVPLVVDLVLAAAGGWVGPEDPFAEVDDVAGLVGEPGVAGDLAACGG